MNKSTCYPTEFFMDQVEHSELVFLPTEFTGVTEVQKGWKKIHTWSFSSHAPRMSAVFQSTSNLLALAHELVVKLWGCASTTEISLTR